MTAEIQQQQDMDGARRNSQLPLRLPQICEGEKLEGSHFEKLIDDDCCKKLNAQGMVGTESVSTAAPTASEGLSSWGSGMMSMDPTCLDQEDEDLFVEEDETSGKMPRPPPGLEIADVTPMPLVSSTSASQDELPSRGSALHASKQCRPCAWFWKPQGCENGKECGHCHLCPKGELKSRKKDKITKMRAETDQDEESPDGKENEQTTPKKDDASEGAQVSGPPGLQPIELPSKGAELHGTGKCRPCAWFWKPEKCLKDKECNYCHICSEDEIKARKKVKGKAMRMGAIQPLKRGTDSRVPRVLNINAVI
eukprot:gnl/TRDRNA2_/TRDRNA2_164156_c2_seq3.p1 gnl/TRDRNA2_/TRDRNA2_164156_c2~~gnl/TRDRNA2_/TRDRNA2_164156_c2_seq3.p1  ORF type:complete len:309 (-),score=74.72 gnl/TRDRNA2_/TRDRNA2_164156_c2_seq3:215-1141(-)